MVKYTAHCLFCAVPSPLQEIASAKLTNKLHSCKFRNRHSMTDGGVAWDRIVSQWSNPGDIFSLLLLVGGDVVQKAIARLVGLRIPIPWSGGTLIITPVAFSFGWVSCAFISLTAALGDHRLMPRPENDVLVVNCGDSGYVRTNNSWILGKILQERDGVVPRMERDGKRHAQTPNGSMDSSTGDVSLAIEIFQAVKDKSNNLRPNLIWCFCLLVIIVQLSVAAIPWKMFHDWSILLITGTGTVLSVVTSSLPQWVDEKWPIQSRPLRKPKWIALTRGNGHQYVMLICCEPGSLDLEALAAGRLHVHPQTSAWLTAMAFCWVVLLITVTGLTDHTWYLILVGGLGMLQHVCLASIPAHHSEYNINLQPHKDRPLIVGYRFKSNVKETLKEHWNSWTMEQAINEYRKPIDEPHVRGVMGALMELEKFKDKAGAHMLPIFFPAGARSETGQLKFRRERYFWAHAAKPGSPMDGETTQQNRPSSATSSYHTCPKFPT